MSHVLSSYSNLFTKLSFYFLELRLLTILKDSGRCSPPIILLVGRRLIPISSIVRAAEFIVDLGILPNQNQVQLALITMAVCYLLEI